MFLLGPFRSLYYFHFFRIEFSFFVELFRLHLMALTFLLCFEDLTVTLFFI
jgi:hypothetical protein